MPVEKGQDKHGKFFRYQTKKLEGMATPLRGKKCYYLTGDDRGKYEARWKAVRQGMEMEGRAPIGYFREF